MRGPEPGAVRRAVAGVVAVAATYVSFLLHAQFGFLALAEQRLGSAHDLQRTMAVMGLAGLAASLAGGALLRGRSPRRFVGWALAGCAATALASLACGRPAAFLLVAALVGASTGLLTVSLASGLRQLLPLHRLGLLAGLGTGMAYFLANLPPIFHGGPVVQALVPAAGCLIALSVLPWMPRPAPGECEPPRASRALSAADCRGLGFVTLVAAFLALVWLDSAAFWIIQETVELRGHTWGEGGRTLVQGSAHLVAAVLAGHLIDRGHLRSLLLATLALFVAAFTSLQQGVLPVDVAGPLYALGISTYSTALVVAPSLGPRGPGLVPVRWRAAVLYAVAGWLGSALGIGMARDLHRIPPAFVVAASLVLLGGAALAARVRWSAPLSAAAPAVVLALIGLPAVLSPTARSAGLGEDAVARGRRVYVAEGCINCHSQYVRPGTADEPNWGPHRVDQLDEAPPLLGLRRNGPDLLNAGNRRSPEWHRLHLRDPRSLDPRSRMPSYAHLFGDGRGEDLVAYLSSLGRGRKRSSTEAVEASASAADLTLGRELFTGSCAPCHGRAGLGDGPLADELNSPFLDLHLAGLPLVPRTTGDPTRDLAAVVRWGLPGGRMPGHELFTDEELSSVVAFVQRLRAADERRVELGP